MCKKMNFNSENFIKNSNSENRDVLSKKRKNLNKDN